MNESERIIYHRDEEAENYSLEIKSVVVEDGASYSFTATNEAGEASKKCLLKVHSMAITYTWYLLYEPLI